MTEPTYGHTPLSKMFDQGDVYGIGFDERRASSRKVKLALIGTGGVAQSKYLPAISRLRMLWEPVEVVGISDPNWQQGEKTAAVYGCRWYEDYADLLEMEPDGVIVLSPDRLHAEHALAALEKGIPVLVEKPLSRTLEDARAMCETAEQVGTLLMPVANKRFSPPYRFAKKLMDDGPLRHPGLFGGKFNLGYDYVDLLEGGTVHLFDLCRFFMGDVDTVHAAGVQKYNRNKTGYPFDHAAITLRFTSGSIGSLYTISSALSLKPWERVEIYGEKSWIAVEDQYELTLHDGENLPSKTWRPAIPNTLMFDEEFGGYLGQVEHFIQCIRGNEQPTLTGWDGYKALELVQATHLSIKTGETVQLLKGW